MGVLAARSAAAAQGVGALIGAVIVPPLAERFGPRRTVLTSLITMPLATAVFGVSRSLVLATSSATVAIGQASS